MRTQVQPRRLIASIAAALVLPLAAAELTGDERPVRLVVGGFGGGNQAITRRPAREIKADPALRADGFHLGAGERSRWKPDPQEGQ